MCESEKTKYFNTITQKTLSKIVKICKCSWNPEDNQKEVREDQRSQTADNIARLYFG